MLEIAGSATPVRSWRSYCDQFPFLPPFPTVEAVPLVRVPDPPRLLPAWTAKACATRLALAYDCTTTYRKTNGHGGRPTSFSRGPLVEHPLCAVLSEAGVLLRDAGIPPHAWVAWSLDVWPEITHRSGAPKPAWVLAPSRIQEGQHWFWDEYSTYAGGQLWYSDEFRRYEAARSKLERRLQSLPAEPTKFQVQQWTVQTFKLTEKQHTAEHFHGRLADIAAIHIHAQRQLVARRDAWDYLWR